MKKCSKLTCVGESQRELWDVCKKFVDELEISCVESVYQSDRVTLNSLEFIEKICDIVGYHQFQEEE